MASEALPLEMILHLQNVFSQSSSVQQSSSKKTTQEPISSKKDSDNNTTTMASKTLLMTMKYALPLEMILHLQNVFSQSSSVQEAMVSTSGNARYNDVMEDTADDDEIQIIGNKNRNGESKEIDNSNSVIIDYEKQPMSGEPLRSLKRKKEEYIQQWLDKFEPIVAIDLFDSDDEEEKNTIRQKEKKSKRIKKRSATEESLECTNDVSIPYKKSKQGKDLL